MNTRCNYYRIGFIMNIKLLYLLLSALLLLCLAPMPYGYYQLVRFISMVLFTSMVLYCLAQAEISSEKSDRWNGERG